MLGVGVPGDNEAPVRSLAVPADAPRIRVRGVTKSFGDVEALAPVSLDVGAGETVTLLGPSGCGKTTLLRLIAGLETPTDGEVLVDGMAPRAARRRKRIGFVPQAPALLPWRTVEANASLLLDVGRTTPSSSERRDVSVGSLLDEVGLGDFRDAYPHELSGGMQQRVGLVRAFALDAPILLMDEPFAALDEMTRTDMRHLLSRLREPLGTSVVFVTHSIAEAIFLSDRVAVMSPRPGTIHLEHVVDLPHPRLPDVEDSAEFFEHSRRLRIELRAGTVS
jgi:NitT/TauT family transport system ATP-binding protein